MIPLRPAPRALVTETPLQVGVANNTGLLIPKPPRHGIQYVPGRGWVLGILILSFHTPCPITLFQGLGTGMQLRN